MGCKDGQTRDEGKIVLIFESPSKKKSLLTYIDDWSIPYKMTVQDITKQIKIATLRPYLDISLQDKSGLISYFLFKNGDSIHIDLGSKDPRTKILNRQVPVYETNFEKWKQNELFGEKEPAKERFFDYWSLVNGGFGLITGDEMAKELQPVKSEALNELVLENNFIDSLVTKERLDSYTASYFNAKNKMLDMLLNLHGINSIDCTKKAMVIQAFKEAHIGLPTQMGNTVAYTFWDDFLKTFYDNCLNKSAVGRKSLREFIASTNEFPPTMRDLLVFKHTEQILQTLSVAKGVETLQELSNNPMHKAWVEHFSKKYNLDQGFDTEWLVYSNNGESITFNELLYKHQGKLLYIDIWASWCHPCLVQMPYFEKLKRAYSEKGVDFIYISIDEDPKNWKWAEEKYLSFDKGNSYRVDSSGYELLKTEFNLNTVPRDLLFGRNGELLHMDAPQPSSLEIQHTLNEIDSDY